MNMRYTQLGTTDVKVSVMAFGCMGLTPETRESGKAAVLRAFELGINSFDTRSDAALAKTRMGFLSLDERQEKQRHNSHKSLDIQIRIPGSGWQYFPSSNEGREPFEVHENEYVFDKLKPGFFKYTDNTSRPVH